VDVVLVGYWLGTGFVVEESCVDALFEERWGDPSEDVGDAVWDVSAVVLAGDVAEQFEPCPPVFAGEREHFSVFGEAVVQTKPRHLGLDPESKLGRQTTVTSTLIAVRM